MLPAIVNRSAFTTLILLTTLPLCSFKLTDTTDRHYITAEMRSSMKNKLLKQWYPLAIDKKYGGFLSSFTFDFKPTDDQDKMIVTQARHTWSNSKAAEMFPTVSYYRKGAKQGFLFLKNKMWDKQYGGFYTYVDQSGKVKDSHFAPKEAYGNSFSIYALAAYYHLSGDQQALKLAIADFMWLEKHSHDSVYKGYFQHMERNGTPIKRSSSTPSTAETGYKDQNTSIHLLEAFTELYAVWPNPLLRTRLREMLLLIRDTIVTPKGYLNLFFTSDWTPVSYRDSSERVILQHRGLNHVSFGHDVETAYLMLEASQALGIKNDAVTLRVGKKMVDHALDNGWDNQLGGFYDEGYYFKGKQEITIIADTKNWWAQAEGLNTLLIMDAEYPKDPHHYYQKFVKLWRYVQTYLIDQEHGDWYQGGLDKQPQLKTALKGQIWKGTYHNLRSLINCIKSLEPNKRMPANPVYLNTNNTNGVHVITWKRLAGNKSFMGYNIYVNNKRTWYTPLKRFSIPSGYLKKALTITAVDLRGNESKPTKIPAF
jgi:mannobiose 2-epimerase